MNLKWDKFNLRKNSRLFNNPKKDSALNIILSREQQNKKIRSAFLLKKGAKMEFYFLFE